MVDENSACFVRTTFPNSDANIAEVFLHQKHKGDFKEGDYVAFMAVLRNGKLQAKDLEPAPASDGCGMGPGIGGMGSPIGGPMGPMNGMGCGQMGQMCGMGGPMGGPMGDPSCMGGKGGNKGQVKKRMWCMTW